MKCLFLVSDFVKYIPHPPQKNVIYIPVQLEYTLYTYFIYFMAHFLTGATNSPKIVII